MWYKTIKPLDGEAPFYVLDISSPYAFFKVLSPSEGWTPGWDRDWDSCYSENAYSIVNELDRHYHSFSIPKRNGSHREIDAPSAHLRLIQRFILESVLYCIPCSKYSKAYCQGKSAKDNARFHQNQKLVLVVDIANFFGSIQSHHVWNIFKDICDYPESVAALLTNLCVYKGHLPQGAPTSPYLSNLILKNFDKTIGEYCHSHAIRYTRYADDMTFSGESFDIAALLYVIDGQLFKLGLQRNQKKTKVMRQNTRQKTTGIVLNKKSQVPRPYRMKIRQEIHYIQTFGLDSHLNKIGSPKRDYLRSLSGRIRYVLSINPYDKQMQRYQEYVDALIVLDKYNTNKNREAK